MSCSAVQRHDVDAYVCVLFVCVGLHQPLKRLLMNPYRCHRRMSPDAWAQCSGLEALQISSHCSTNCILLKNRLLYIIKKLTFEGLSCIMIRIVGYCWAHVDSDASIPLLSYIHSVFSSNSSGKVGNNIPLHITLWQTCFKNERRVFPDFHSRYHVIGLPFENGYRYSVRNSS